MGATTGVLRIEARDVREGDEVLVGPQGRIPEAPTVIAVDADAEVVRVVLREDGPLDEQARWCPDTRLTVLRPSAASGGVASVPAVEPIQVKRGPDERDYEVRSRDGSVWIRFSTEGIDGRSADETAVGNAVAVSQQQPGVFIVTLLAGGGHREVVLAEAEDGVGRLLQPQDALSADSMYGTQLSPEEREHWTRQASVRSGLDEPTCWGQDVA